MASEVDICNLALSHLGDDGTITAINPPDGSTQAGYAKRFYPIARGLMLEAFDWSFAAARTSNLAEVTNTSSAWAFAYALPSDCIKPRKLLALGATDETKGETYAVEERTLYTNSETPTLIYTKLVTDTTKYTTAFVSAFSKMLASQLAGPLTKSPKIAQAWWQMAMDEGAQAAKSNANSTSVEEHSAPASWMTSR